MMLKYVWYDMRSDNDLYFRLLRERLEQTGVICSRWREQKTGEVSAKATEKTADFKDALFITDDPEKARNAFDRGIICVGIQRKEQSSYFEGAGLVITADPEEVDVRMLEEYLLREQGLPVTIWESEELVLREITDEDIPALHAISREVGMEYARYEPDGEDSFSEERLHAYIRQQYRFYGYGLWSILKKEAGGAETVIGCCGFSEDEISREEEKDQNKVTLEMQYMLTERARNRGYGTEACLAALDYAGEYLEAEQITIRVHPENRRAKMFAEKLGFVKDETADSDRKRSAFNILRKQISRPQ